MEKLILPILLACLLSSPALADQYDDGYDVFFWVNGRDSAKRAEQLLDEITRTSRGWQKDIMDSANQMLNSRPEIAAHQMYMSKIEAATKISDDIQDNLNNVIQEKAQKHKQPKQKK